MSATGPTGAQGSVPAGPAVRARRADARRNESALLDAAATVFVESGVQAPVRRVAAAAGVSTATIYRHFPTRADLIVAVYRHQVQALAVAGPALLAEREDPLEALRGWVDLFVDFLVTKQGLATVLQSTDPCHDPLHAYFLERPEPVCASLLARSLPGRAVPSAYELMRGIGAICAASGDERYDARRLSRLLLAGLSCPHGPEQVTSRTAARPAVGVGSRPSPS